MHFVICGTRSVLQGGCDSNPNRASRCAVCMSWDALQLCDHGCLKTHILQTSFLHALQCGHMMGTRDSSLGR